MFDEKSRYAGLPTRSHAMADGRVVTYVSRRLVPPANAYVIAGGVTVTDSERLDHLAQRHLGLASAFWQIADANNAMHPQMLTAQAGRRLAIPLPRVGNSG
jgi:hypothetical protein